MDALTTAVVPANVIRQVFTEATERLKAEAYLNMQNMLEAHCTSLFPRRRWGREQEQQRRRKDLEMAESLSYYTLMLYTIETNAVVHMTQEQIQRMQQVDAENKAARKYSVRDGE